MSGHGERAHSIFSASGAERWLNCPASVKLSEQAPPEPDSPWAKEGTLAHEVLEAMLNRGPLPKGATPEMLLHCTEVKRKILAIHQAAGGRIFIERKVYATFIHEEMFGTCDAIVAGDDGWLHIIDFKYGAGHIVDPKENPQLIQYALSVAESYDWAFDKVTCHIMQPRGGANWHKRWVVTVKELREGWLPLWEKGVKRALDKHAKPFAGRWCHWCKARTICPLKAEQRAEKIENVFSDLTTNEVKNGDKEKSKTEKSGGQGGGQAARQKSESRKVETQSFEDEDFF